MRIISKFKIKTKILPFTISIVGVSLLVSLTTSCSSTTPSDEILPVAEGNGIATPNSPEIWSDNREFYLKSVEKSLYKKEGITNSIIESNQGKNERITLDKTIFLIQSCEYGNQQACDFIRSQPN